MSKVISIACAVLLTAVAGACEEDPVETFDRNTDCAQICDDFKMCFSTSDYDVDECTDSCSEMVSEEDTDQIDECENCLDDASCGEAIGCTAECAGLVPVTTD